MGEPRGRLVSRRARGARACRSRLAAPAADGRRLGRRRAAGDLLFVAGLELKRELTVGQLADRRAAMLPFFAAGGGMLSPRARRDRRVRRRRRPRRRVGHPGRDRRSRVALGVLALAGSSLPPRRCACCCCRWRSSHDLAAIALIAVLFTAGLSPAWLAAGVAAGGAYWLAQSACASTPRGCCGRSPSSPGSASTQAPSTPTVTGIMLGLLNARAPARRRDERPAQRYEHEAVVHPDSSPRVTDDSRHARFARRRRTARSVAAAHPAGRGRGRARPTQSRSASFAGICSPGSSRASWVAPGSPCGCGSRRCPPGPAGPTSSPSPVLAGIGYTESACWSVQLSLPGRSARSSTRRRPCSPPRRSPR